jgi:hypothetical protein
VAAVVEAVRGADKQPAAAIQITRAVVDKPASWFAGFILMFRFIACVPNGLRFVLWLFVASEGGAPGGEVYCRAMWILLGVASSACVPTRGPSDVEIVPSLSLSATRFRF